MANSKKSSHIRNIHLPDTDDGGQEIHELRGYTGKQVSHAHR